jgi:hypothetical protein
MEAAETNTEIPEKEPLKERAKPLLGYLWLFARIVLAIMLVVLADRIAAGRISTSAAVAVAGLTVAAVFVLALTPRLGRALAQRIAKVSLGPLAFEVFKAAQKTMPSMPTEDPERRERRVTSILALRLKIERKLTYIAKQVLDNNGHPTFLTIGSLKYDGYLPESDADVLNRLMTLRDEDLSELPPREQDEFLAITDKIARNIRASVLNGLVRKSLEGSGWNVSEIPRGADKRPDLDAEKHEYRCRIAPVFATDEESSLLDRAIERLSPATEGEDRYALRAIVLPHNSNSPKNRPGDPAVLTTDEFLEILDESARAAVELVGQPA